MSVKDMVYLIFFKAEPFILSKQNSFVDLSH